MPFGALIFPEPNATPNGERFEDGEHGKPARVRYLLDEGRFELRDIRVGVTSRVAAEVLSGLEEGDRIVVGSL